MNRQLQAAGMDTYSMKKAEKTIKAEYTPGISRLSNTR
jgi:hypothetical protein